jgi:hypothetical protein
LTEAYADPSTHFLRLLLVEIERKKPKAKQIANNAVDIIESGPSRSSPAFVINTSSSQLAVALPVLSPKEVIGHGGAGVDDRYAQVGAGMVLAMVVLVWVMHGVDRHCSDSHIFWLSLVNLGGLLYVIFLVNLRFVASVFGTICYHCPCTLGPFKLRRIQSNVRTPFID